MIRSPALSDIAEVDDDLPAASVVVVQVPPASPEIGPLDQILAQGHRGAMGGNGDVGLHQIEQARLKSPEQKLGMMPEDASRIHEDRVLQIATHHRTRIGSLGRVSSPRATC